MIRERRSGTGPPFVFSSTQKFANDPALPDGFRSRKKRIGSEKLIVNDEAPGPVISVNGPETLLEVCNIRPGVHCSVNPLPTRRVIRTWLGTSSPVDRIVAG